jgi:hypothetical protein
MRTLEDAKFEDVLACYDRENAGSEALDCGAGYLRAADNNGAGKWILLMLSMEEALNIMLPHHRRCGVELVPVSGLTVSAAADTAEAITGKAGKCWGNIASSKDRDFSKMHVFVKAENNRLTHLDGLHRLLAWALFDRQIELHAYVVQLG